MRDLLYRCFLYLFGEIIIAHVLKNIQIGGHCGLCGDWIDIVLANQSWPIVVCRKCRGEE